MGAFALLNVPVQRKRDIKSTKALPPPESLCDPRGDVRRPEFSVFVGDLASDVDDFQLHQVFKKFPSCKGAKVVTDQYGYSR